MYIHVNLSNLIKKNYTIFYTTGFKINELYTCLAHSIEKAEFFVLPEYSV